MDVFTITYRVGRVKSSTGVKVDHKEPFSDIIVTYDPAKLSKKAVYKLVRAQLIYYEVLILERIISHLPKDIS